MRDVLLRRSPAFAQQSWLGNERPALVALSNLRPFGLVPRATGAAIKVCPPEPVAELGARFGIRLPPGL